MAYEFKFPDVGEGIHEGKIVKWLVHEGDTIKADDSIAEVETDKAIVEIPSPVGGKILKVTHQEGDIIKVGEILATIEEVAGGEKKTAKAESEKEEKRESTGVVGSLEETARGVMKAPALSQSGAVFGGTASPEGEASHQQKFAQQTPRSISMEQLAEEEKKKAAPGAPAAAGGTNVVKAGLKAVKKYDMFGYVDRMPYDSVRRAVGQQMVKSMFTIPHVTHTDMADVTDLWALREKEKKAAEKQGIKLTFLPYFIKAVVAGLKKHPYLNAMLDEEAGQIILKKYYNIGLAVDTEAGLMVPVLKGADKKSIVDMAKEISELAEKARSRKINPMDFKGGTFTITNIGSAGSGWFATPVINFPEAAILGTGMIQDMPVARGGKVEVRKMLPLSLTFDHRILDGAEAARFTLTVKEQLENPAGLV